MKVFTKYPDIPCFFTLHRAHLNEEDNGVKKVRSVATSTLKEVPYEPESHEAVSLTGSIGREQKQEENPNCVASGSVTPPDPVNILTPASVFSLVESHIEQGTILATDNNSVKTSTSEAQQNHTGIQRTQQIPAQPQNLKKNFKESKSDDTEKRKISLWRDSSYEVYVLEGHNDIILAVDCMDDFVLSAR